MSRSIHSLIAISLLFAGRPSFGADTPRPERARFRILERKADGKTVPVPARVHLADSKGRPERPPGLPFFRDHFVTESEFELALEPGLHRFEVERGPEYRRESGGIEIVPGKSVERVIVLERLIDMSALGLRSGDTHIHRAIEDVPLLARAEDLHFAPVMTVWNKTNLWEKRPLPEKLLVEIEPGRRAHLLSAEDEREGGALLYLGLKRPLELTRDEREYPSPMKHLEEALAQGGVHVDVEKPFWWDMPTWIASGKVATIGLANNHMCRSSMYETEAWGRPRDDKRLPAPRGNGFYSQEIYYRLLNCGIRVPPSAGSASGVLPNPVGYNRVYVNVGDDDSFEGWRRGLVAGRSFVTNGPLALVEANGKPPGEVFKAPAAGRIEISVEARFTSNDPIEAIELIRQGRVVERIVPEGSRTVGRARFKPLAFDRPGWFLVRVLADVPRTFRFASTAPFYVEVGEKRSEVGPEDVAYFVRWIEDRIKIIEEDKRGYLKDVRKREEVLEPHRRALAYFKNLLK